VLLAPSNGPYIAARILSFRSKIQPLRFRLYRKSRLHGRTCDRVLFSAVIAAGIPLRGLLQDPERIAKGRDGCTMAGVFEIKKEIRAYTLPRFVREENSDVFLIHRKGGR
jgi:hypothetical protein